MATEKLSRTLEKLLASAGLPAVALQVSLSRAWGEIAGPLLAGKARPFRVRSGVLTVHVLNPSWAQELQLSKPVLLGRIEAALGEGKIRDIRFVVGPVSPPGKDPSPAGGEPERGEVPPLRSPDELDGIRDPETRELLRSICRKSSRRKE